MNQEFSLNSDAARTDLSAAEIASVLARTQKEEIPFFARYEPDFATLQQAAEKYRPKKHVIIEGNGGSMSTLRAFCSCFGAATGREIHLLDTSDPDAVAEIKVKCPTAETLLIVISKSGESIDAVAGYLSLAEYETVFVTGPEGALFELGKTQNLAIFRHPDLSGRFSGLSECALLPAAVLGMDAEGLYRGGRAMYETCAPTVPFASNPALQFAASLDKLEKEGYTSLFLSIYSKKLSGLFELVTQLFHEGVCKDGLGQTVYGGEAPENQHHTLQRFNSGRKDSIGVFVTVDSFQDDFQFKAEQSIKNISCRNLKIGQLEKMSMQDVIHTEFAGTWQDTVEKGIPAFHLQLGEVSPRSVGMLIAFWQYAAFYSSLLREVNPFNQPGVERSKEYIFQLLGEK